MKTLMGRSLLPYMIGLGALFCATSCGKKAVDEQQSPGHATVSSASLQTEASTATPESLGKLLGEIEDLVARSPRDRIDPAAVVDPSRDPEKILAWVRANTRLVAYEGSLKGPLGVLMDRHGNSLDRALLLARLLELSGHEVRIVGGRLTSNDEAKLLADGAKTGVTHSQAAPSESDTESQTKKQATNVAAMIADNVGPLKAITPVPQVTHYWVQFNDGKRWVDADPSLEGIGQTRLVAGNKPIAVDPKSHGVARPAPNGDNLDDLRHSVTMRLVVERWEAGKLIEDTLAVVPFDAVDDGPTASTIVTFVPVNPDAGKAVQRSFSSGAELSETLLGERAWAVVLVDTQGNVRMGRMFDDAGIVSEVPKSFDPTGKLAGVAGSAFGGLAGGLEADETEAESATIVTSLIADYEIKVPGKRPRQLRRYIFDSIGPESRRSSGQPIARPHWTDEQAIDRGADLAAINETLVSFASLPSDEYVDRFARRLVDSKDAILKVIAGDMDEDARQRAGSGMSFRPLELFAATRDSTMNQELAIVEPQVARRIIRYVPNTNTTGLDLEMSGDLVWNRVAPASGSASAANLVTQGVLDTLHEPAIVLHNGPALPGQSTAALFEEATKQGIGITTVRNADDARLAGFPGPARARMLEDLEAGQVLVVPSKPIVLDGRPRVGWWRIDPSSGQAVGMMDTGLGAVIVTYVVPVTTVSGIVITKFVPIAASPAVQQWAANMARLAADPSLYDRLLRFAAGVMYLTNGISIP